MEKVPEEKDLKKHSLYLLLEIDQDKQNPSSNMHPINTDVPWINSALSYNIASTQSNTKHSPLKTGHWGNPHLVSFSSEEHMWLVVLCHTGTSHKLLSKFLLPGNILLNVSAALVLIRGTLSFL